MKKLDLTLGIFLLSCAAVPTHAAAARTSVFRPSANEFALALNTHLRFLDLAGLTPTAADIGHISAQKALSSAGDPKQAFAAMTILRVLADPSPERFARLEDFFGGDPDGRQAIVSLRSRAAQFDGEGRATLAAALQSIRDSNSGNGSPGSLFDGSARRPENAPVPTGGAPSQPHIASLTATVGAHNEDASPYETLSTEDGRAETVARLLDETLETWTPVRLHVEGRSPLDINLGKGRIRERNLKTVASLITDGDLHVPHTSQKTIVLEISGRLSAYAQSISEAAIFGPEAAEIMKARIKALRSHRRDRVTLDSEQIVSALTYFISEKYKFTQWLKAWSHELRALLSPPGKDSPPASIAQFIRLVFDSAKPIPRETTLNLTPLLEEPFVYETPHGIHVPILADVAEMLENKTLAISRQRDGGGFILTADRDSPLSAYEGELAILLAEAAELRPTDKYPWTDWREKKDALLAKIADEQANHFAEVILDGVDPLINSRTSLRRLLFKYPSKPD